MVTMGVNIIVDSRWVLESKRLKITDLDIYTCKWCWAHKCPWQGTPGYLLLAALDYLGKASIGADQVSGNSEGFRGLVKCQSSAGLRAFSKSVT